MAERPMISAAELGDRSWGWLTDAVRRLEQSWRASPNPELSQFVPPAGDPLRERVLVELIKVDQEYRWQAGQPQRLEAYLSQWPELDGKPELLTQLLAAECLTRATLDTVPTSDELQTRFPEISGHIDLAAIHAKAESERASGQAVAAPAAESDTSRDGLEYTASESRVPLPPAVGRRFGRYEIRELLDRGGMGTVYRAYDTQLEREVALKIPRVDLIADETVRERFLREGRSAAAIQHRNVCPIYDAGEIEGTYYITMALIEGPSLAAWMEDRTIDPREGADLVRKLARALETVHAAGVLHRDVKPSNVMIDQSGEPLLMDFGLARQTESNSRLTGSGSFLGTPAYMSPEQANGRVVDARSDVYGLGLLLYQMLTGALPFTGPPAKLLSSIVRSPPARPGRLRPDLDRRLEAICLKAMAKDPAHRYQTARELAEALERYLEGEPESAGRPSRRRRLTWITAAAAALLLVFGAVITVVTNRGTLEIKTLDEDVKVSVLKNGQEVIIVDTKTQKKIRLHAGRYELRLSEGQEGLCLTTKEFTLRRGEKMIVQVRSRIEPGPPSVARSDHDLPSPREPLAAGPSAPGDLLQVFEPPAGEGGGFGHWIAAEDNKVLIGAVYGNAAYLYDARTGALLHTFRGKGGHFGLAVAMAGDTVLVTASSATNDSTNATDAGAIYLFHFNESGNEWEEPIIVYGKAPHDQLGCCVASFGDNFLVGASQQQAGSGEAYLFDGSSGKRLLTFRNPRGAAGRGDYFGLGLAALGNDVLIGAPHDDTDAPDAGIVYLFDGTTGRLRLTLHNPKGAAGAGNWFGYVQTIAGVDGNILVGNYLFDGSTGKLLRTFGSGGVVTRVGNNALIGTSLFDSRTGDILQTFRAPPGAGGRFGHTIGALDNNVLIGAFHAKKVYLFAGPESHTAEPGPPSVARSDRDLPSPREPLAAGGSAPGDLLQVFEPPGGEGGGFGHSIAAEDNKVLIGAGYGNAAYLYDARTGALLHTFRGKGGYFGIRVAMAGNRVLVADHGDDAKGSDAGAVYCFEFNQSSGEWEEPTIVYGEAAGHSFGYSIAIVGNNVAIGAQQATGGIGKVYLFDGTKHGIHDEDLLLTIENPSPNAGDYFGNSLAALGNNVLVGAPHDDTYGASAGIAYLFSGVTGQRLQTFPDPSNPTHPPTPSPGHWFGYTHCLTAVGDNILVGSYRGPAAYLFTFNYSTESWDLLHTFPDPLPGSRAYFARVAAVGENILMCAYKRDMVYLYDGASGNLLHTFVPTPAAPGGSFGHTVTSLDNNVLIGAFHAKKVYLFAGPESHTAEPGPQGGPP